MIPALSTMFTALSAAAVGWGLGMGDPVVLVPASVGLLSALPLQALSYQVFAEHYHTLYDDHRPPQEVLWHNPYTNS